jgi:hypothetical protein
VTVNDRQDIPSYVAMLASSVQVVHVPDVQSFSATDEKTSHSVQIFPRETCTCPASKICCHRIQAKASIGLETRKRKDIKLYVMRRRAK